MAKRAQQSSRSPSRARKGDTALNALPSVNDIAAANKIDFKPANPRQRLHMRGLKSGQLTVATGPAGTGKTQCNCSFAADGILKGTITRVVMMRPPAALEDTKHETLPGDLFAKIAPWAQPMLKKLGKLIGKARLEAMIRSGQVEVKPFTYIRGDEFEAGTFVMLDEAQNCTYAQIKAFTTRIADGSIISISGDITQNDLETESGLAVLIEVIEMGGIDCTLVKYLEKDIMRGKLCAQFVKAWDKLEKKYQKLADAFENGVEPDEIEELDAEAEPAQATMH